MERNNETSPVPFSVKKSIVAILAALLFSCTLALFGPAQLFLTNALEFDFSFSQLLPFLGAITIGIFILVASILVLLPDRFGLHERGVAAVFALGFLLWVQGNVLVWHYGLLNGHDIEWGKKVLFGLLDTPLWIVGLLLAACRPGFLYRRVKSLSLLLLSIQLLVTFFYVIRQPESPSFKKYQIDIADKFVFSNHKNVIILVLDSFQSDVFQEIIDQDPSYKDYFRNFTYFRDTVGGYPSTYAAIPFLLTSQYYTNSTPIQAFIADAYLSPSSIPCELQKLGWRVDLFPAVSRSVFFDPQVFSNIRAHERKVNHAKLAYLYDLTLFRYLPHFLKREIYNDQAWFLARWRWGGERTGMLADNDLNIDARQAFANDRKARRSLPHIGRFNKIGIPRKNFNQSAHVNPDARFVSQFLTLAVVATERNVLKFYHWRGPHEPIRMNSELAPVSLPLSRPNLVDLARGELKLVHFFLEGLRQLGVYDEALIFVLGDHGQPWGAYGLRVPPGMTGTQPGASPLPKGVLESGIPLLLVKRPGDRGNLEIIDAPASLADVSATVFDSLGLGRTGIGEPLFQIPADRRRERRFLYYNWSHSDWKNRYLPDLVEYRVDGNGWLAASWRPTGKVFRPED